MMKTFTKIGLLLLTAFAGNDAMAQCTPNTTMPKGTILPDALQLGYVNNAYSEVIYFRAPSDTTATVPIFGTVPVRIDSMKITGVAGLPSGFSYTCNNTNCVIKGGESGCVTLTGTPQANGIFPLKVQITTYGTALIPDFGDIPSSQNDVNEKYTLYIYNNVGLNDNVLKRSVSLYPNPARNSINISNDLNIEMKAELLDITGKLIDVKTIVSGHTFDVSHLPKGVYLVSLQSASERFVQKVIVE